MKKLISAFLFMFSFFAVFGLFSYTSKVSAATFGASHQQLTLDDGVSAVKITVESTPGDEISITVAESNTPNIFVYANQKTVDAQGIVEFTFKTGEDFPAGTYYYNVYSNNNGTVLDPVPSFQYYSIEKINKNFADLYALRLLQDETEKIEKAYELIDENSEMLRVNTLLYSKFTEYSKVPENALLSVLETQYTFNSIGDFASTFYDNLCVDAIISLRDYDDMILLYSESGDLSIAENIGLGTTGTTQDLQRYERFSKMSNDVKKQVVKEIDIINPDSVETFLDAFSQAVLVTEMRNVVNWEMVDKLILDNSDLLESADTYIALDDSQKKAEICLELYDLISSDTIESASDFSSKLEDMLTSDAPVTEEKPTIITGKPGGSSGGGGGGGGSAIKVGLEKEPEESDEENIKETTQPKDEILKKSHSFEDVDTVAWAKDAIDVLFVKGVINGKSETVFAPNDKVTREEFIKMACELFGFTNSQAVCSFEDVSSEDWFYSYVASAQEKGLVKGISESEFGKGTALTREDLVTFAYRFAVAANVNFNNDAAYIPFNDHDLVADYAKEALQVLARYEIISGKEDNMFYPEEHCTRAETAKILYGIYKNLY